MDDIDLDILRMLRVDVRMPIKQIADYVAISVAAVSKRISAMKDQGIICPSYVLVSAAAFGYTMRCFIDVDVPKQNRAGFEDFITKADNVMEANYVTGEHTALIKGAFRNVDELNEFIKQLEVFGETYTRIGLDRLVTSKGLPLPKKIEQAK